MHAPDPQSAICSPRSSIAAAPSRRRIEAAVAVGRLAFSGLAFLLVAALFILNPPPAHAACNPATIENCCASNVTTECEAWISHSRIVEILVTNSCQPTFTLVYEGASVQMKETTTWQSRDPEFECPPDSEISKTEEVEPKIYWEIVAVDNPSNVLASGDIASGGIAQATTPAGTCAEVLCTFTLVDPDQGDDCPAYTNSASATGGGDVGLDVPPVVGVNDLVLSCEDSVDSVQTVDDFVDDQADLQPVSFTPCPDDEGDATLTASGAAGGGGVRVLGLKVEGGVTNLYTGGAISPANPPVPIMLEGVSPSRMSNDVLVVFAHGGCVTSCPTTVVQVELDKFCYTRADPCPEVEIVDVADLVPAGQATVTYKVLDDMLDKDLPELTDTFSVEEAFGTYEYATPPYANRIGNQGHDAIRYTVFDNAGTKAVRWSHADPSHRATTANPGASTMTIGITDALAATPDEALGHLASEPAFGGGAAVEGQYPEYTVTNVVVLAKPPLPCRTNEVFVATLGEDKVLQQLLGVTRDSAVVLGIAGTNVLCVNDRFVEDPGLFGDDASVQRREDDPDFILLTLEGVPPCLTNGTVTWTASDRVRLVSQHGAVAGTPQVQVGLQVSHAFTNAPPAPGMLRVAVEGRSASDAIGDVTVTATVTPVSGEGRDNPKAFAEQVLTAEFKLTVADLRWTGWAPDGGTVAGGGLQVLSGGGLHALSEGGLEAMPTGGVQPLSGGAGSTGSARTPARGELLVCDLDLRPAVKIDSPAPGASVVQGGSLTVRGRVCSMVDIVGNIYVNGNWVPPAQIKFLNKYWVVDLTAESVRALTDRPPPYVVEFEYEFGEQNPFTGTSIAVEARNGATARPGTARMDVLYAEYPPPAGTAGVAQAAVSAPAYREPEPEMVKFFGEFLYKLEVDHPGAGVGLVEFAHTGGEGIEGIDGTAGAQAGGGLYRLSRPVIFLPRYPVSMDSSAIPGPGMQLWSVEDSAAGIEATYTGTEKPAVKKLFEADLDVRDETGEVPDVDEWWHGALLAAVGGPGALVVRNPFGQAYLPDDAELALTAEPVEGWDNPFPAAAPRTWSAMEGDTEIALDPDGPGAACFVLTLSSAKWGLLARDRVRVSVLEVDLDIDSLNQAGTGAPPDTGDVDAVEDLDGPGHPGKIVHMNDMDVDGDKIPDFLDGFEGLAGAKGRDAVAQDASFAQLRLRSTLPADVGFSAHFVFTYDGPSDPALVAGMHVGVALSKTQESVHGNPLGAGIRIWRKNANEPRDSTSIAEGGDYVPPGVAIPYSMLCEPWMLNDDGSIRLYVEGIGTCAGWGTSKVKVALRLTENGPDLHSDSVSYTVVRCVYKVCSWRPYVCIRDSSGAITNRVVFRTDYSTPRTMFADYAYGFKRGDDKFHGGGAFMGHAFARHEVRTPTISTAYWTGQTGANSPMKDYVLTDVYDHVKDGEIYWTTFTGSEDEQAKSDDRWFEYYIRMRDESLLTDGSSRRKMIAVVEHRVMPDTSDLLHEFRSTHNFGRYGLDATVAPPTRCGCGTYVGLLTQRAGLERNGWVTDVSMPIVSLSTLPSTWAGALLYAAQHGKYSLIDVATTEFCDDALHPETWMWNVAGSRSLKFVDPAQVADWCDAKTSRTAGNKDRCVIIRYDVPAVDNLEEWRR